MLPSYRFLWPVLIASVLPAASYAQTVSAAPSLRQPQHPAYLRLGVGRTEIAAGGNYYGLRVALEYTQLLGQHWAASGRLVGIGGAPQSGMQSQIPNQNYKAGYAETEALWYPFGNAHRVAFAVGAGGYAGYYKHNGFDFIGTYPDGLRYGLASWQGAHAGLLGSLNVEVGLGNTQRWRVGAKVMKETGFGGVTTFTSHSLTLARRL